VVMPRVFKLLFSAAAGALAAMFMLSQSLPWAYQTEFKSWLMLTTIHSGLLVLLMIIVFGNSRPTLLSLSGAAKCLGVAGIGGLLAFLIIPYGFVLVKSGLAFISAVVATVSYLLLAAVNK